MFKLPDSTLGRTVLLILAVVAYVAVFSVLPPLGQGAVLLLTVVVGYLAFDYSRRP